MNENDAEILERKTVHDGHARIDRIRLRHRLHESGWSGTISRELVERGHAAAVLPFDPVRDEVVLIRQFRIGAPGRRGVKRDTRVSGKRRNAPGAPICRHEMGQYRRDLVSTTKTRISRPSRCPSRRHCRGCDRGGSATPGPLSRCSGWR
jgi:hypothetical protein